MKRFDQRGVSAVIATILLIALTVAAVGMVATILTTIGTPTPAPTITFGTPIVYVGMPAVGGDNSVVIDLPITSGLINMMELKAYMTCFIPTYLGPTVNNVTVTYTAQLGNDGVKAPCMVSPPAPAQGVPSTVWVGTSYMGVYVQYYGTPVRSAGDKISFFFQSDNAPTNRLLPTIVGSTVTIKLVHAPSATTIFEDTVMTRSKVW